MASSVGLACDARRTPIVGIAKLCTKISCCLLKLGISRTVSDDIIRPPAIAYSVVVSSQPSPSSEIYVFSPIRTPFPEEFERLALPLEIMHICFC
jgi:hypothetical protein